MRKVGEWWMGKRGLGLGIKINHTHITSVYRWRIKASTYSDLYF